MIENILHPRIIENKDWALTLFVMSFATIAVIKMTFENRFSDFSNLIFSDKYLKVYKDNSHLMSAFTISLFFIQVISFAFFILFMMSSFGQASKTDWVLYIQIVTFLLFIILSKYLTEKIIATAFNLDEFADHFNMQKVTYRTYLGLFLLPINIILFYYDTIPTNIFVFLAYMLLVTNVLTYTYIIKNHQNLILSKLLYFILYLCALEIAPYYFIYYWFTKGIV